MSPLLVLVHMVIIKVLLGEIVFRIALEQNYLFCLILKARLILMVYITRRILLVRLFLVFRVTQITIYITLHSGSKVIF